MRLKVGDVAARNAHVEDHGHGAGRDETDGLCLAHLEGRRLGGHFGLVLLEVVRLGAGGLVGVVDGGLP